VDAVPHGLDPLAAQDTKDDHERVEEVGEVPQRHDARLGEVVERVVGAKQLHAHDGEDEDEDGEDEAEVAESTQCAADDTHEQIQRRPRLGQLEHSQLQVQTAFPLPCYQLY